MQPYLTKLISTNGSKVVAIDIHVEKNLLYFTIEESNTLYVFNWIRKSNTMNSVKNIGKPSDVGIDWITENVYFIDDSRAINVCHMNTHYCIRLIVSRKSEDITSLAIDAIHYRLFYATRNRY